MDATSFQVICGSLHYSDSSYDKAAITLREVAEGNRDLEHTPSDAERLHKEKLLL